MKKETITKIRSNPYLYQYLRENSYHYKYLYRDDNYLKEIEKQMKEYYKLTPSDKLERLQDKINLIQTFMSVIE